MIQKEISFDSGLPALSNSLISMVMDQNIFYYLVEYSAFSLTVGEDLKKDVTIKYSNVHYLLCLVPGVTAAAA